MSQHDFLNGGDASREANYASSGTNNYPVSASGGFPVPSYSNPAPPLSNTTNGVGGPYTSYPIFNPAIEQVAPTSKSTWRTVLIVFSAISILGMPSLVFVVRVLQGTVGWLTFGMILTVFPYLAIMNVILLAISRRLPTSLPPSRFWNPAGISVGYYLFWIFGTIGLIFVPDAGDDGNDVPPLVLRNLDSAAAINAANLISTTLIALGLVAFGYAIIVSEKARSKFLARPTLMPRSNYGPQNHLKL